MDRLTDRRCFFKVCIIVSDSFLFLVWELIRIVGGILVYLVCIVNFNVFVV